MISFYAPLIPTHVVHIAVLRFEWKNNIRSLVMSIKGIRFRRSYTRRDGQGKAGREIQTCSFAVFITVRVGFVEGLFSSAGARYKTDRIRITNKTLKRTIMLSVENRRCYMKTRER